MLIFGFSRKRPIGMCYLLPPDDCGSGDGGGSGSGSGMDDMAGAGAGDGGGAGAGAGDGAPSTPDFFVPDTFKDKPYLKDVKDWDSLYKKMDGAQELIGKKAVPKYDDKPEVWEAYFAKTRPEGGKYDIKDEGIFENFRGNEEFTKGLAGVFSRAGLTQKQVDILMDSKDGYTGFIQAEVAKMSGAAKEQAAASDARFDSKAAEILGDRKDAAISNAVAMLGEASTELGLDDGLDALIAQDPDKLVGLAARLDYIHRTYVSGDKLEKPGGGGGGNGGSNDPATLQARLDKYKSDNWKDYTNPSSPAYPEITSNVNKMTTELMKVSSLK